MILHNVDELRLVLMRSWRPSLYVKMADVDLLERLNRDPVGYGKTFCELALEKPFLLPRANDPAYAGIEIRVYLKERRCTEFRVRVQRFGLDGLLKGWTVERFAYPIELRDVFAWVELEVEKLSCYTLEVAV